MLTAAGATGLAIGELVVTIPTHAFAMVNLNSELAVVGADGAVRWQSVEVRGWR